MNSITCEIDPVVINDSTVASVEICKAPKFCPESTDGARDEGPRSPGLGNLPAAIPVGTAVSCGSDSVAVQKEWGSCAVGKDGAVDATHCSGGSIIDSGSLEEAKSTAP